MSAEHEATETAPTFDYFGRTWTMPPALLYAHQRTMIRIGGALGIVEALLDEPQKDILASLGVKSEELDGFTDAMAEAMGVGNSGNSQPSTSSS